MEQVQKWYAKHANKTRRHVEFEVGQHVWLNIRDFKMPDGLTPCFIAKYARPYETLHKPHYNVYTLKLSTNFVTHPTFHVSKLKLFLSDDQKPNQKQKVRLKVDAIEHRLIVEIKGILCAKQTCLKGKEYLVQYKGCHHKETVWIKHAHLDHLP
jgi:hypothetical protein